MAPKKHQGSPGRFRTTTEASRWWKAQAAAVGGVATLAREVGLPPQTITRFIDRAGVRQGNATEGDAVMRARGFVGPSGLERLAAPAPAIASEPPPEAA